MRKPLTALAVGAALAACAPPAAPGSTQVPSETAQVSSESAPAVGDEAAPAPPPEGPAAPTDPASERAAVTDAGEAAPRGTLQARRCVGKTPPPEPPHTAACCYPNKEQLIGPLRRAAPALQRCFEARHDRAASGRTLVAFRIEQDGRVAQVCAEPSSTFVDAAATDCMLRVVAGLRYPATTDAELRLCGLTKLVYPIALQP